MFGILARTSVAFSGKISLKYDQWYRMNLKVKVIVSLVQRLLKLITIITDDDDNCALL